jgi:hypothetical protein
MKIPKRTKLTIIKSQYCKLIFFKLRYSTQKFPVVYSLYEARTQTSLSVCRDLVPLVYDMYRVATLLQGRQTPLGLNVLPNTLSRPRPGWECSVGGISSRKMS